MYKNTVFKIELDGVASNWEKQRTGIRQGCPLSPYLFVTVMTIMFNKVHYRLWADMIEHRVQGVEFDEIMYADDTICVSENREAMETLLKDIEEEEGGAAVEEEYGEEGEAGEEEGLALEEF